MLKGADIAQWIRRHLLSLASRSNPKHIINAFIQNN